MIIRSGLPVDYWWDAYEASNFITNRLPTKTVFGYQTPYEGVYQETPDLSMLRVWGCKSYIKIPKTYLRKDWRDKCQSGYLMGYSEDGEMGWKLYIPELKDIVVGVNCTFNEVIPAYREEYFQELNKMKFEMAKDESTVDSFAHLVGEKYTDDESLLEYVTTRVALYKGLIVAYRAPVNKTGRVGFEEKSPIHIADVVRMCELSTSRLNDEESERSAEPAVRSILKAAGHEAQQASTAGSTKKVRFALQEPDRDGHDRPRGVASELKQPNSHKRASTMRSAHDTQPRSDELSARVSHRPETAHKTVPEVALRHKSNDVTVSSRTVTRYDATPPEVTLDSAVDQNQPKILERDSIPVDAGYDTFVAHKWGKTDKPISDKRIKIPRIVTNATNLGNIFTATDTATTESDVFPEKDKEADQGEVAPEKYGQAVDSPEWRESMMNEIRALRNRGCWRVVPTPHGVRLIKSKYVYKLKKDWTGKVVKRKSRLVVQGFLQQEGVDYGETYAPVAKAATFRLMLALTKAKKLHLHQLDVDSAFPYADLAEDMYMTPPPGMELDEGFCLKLLKSLYGLKQAPRNWHKLVVDLIKSMGFKQCVLDNCLFVKHIGTEIYLISLYVDDILIAGTDLQEVKRIKQQFTDRFEMKDMGELNYYLGMKITRTNDFIKLDQAGYLREILEKYSHLLRGMDTKRINTPMESELKLRKFEREAMTPTQWVYVSRFPYQNLVGALLYLAINTRPDISYAVGVLARFNTYPNFRACKALIRVLLYLRGTPDVGIQFTGKSLNLFGYSDADWAGDLDSRRSTTGYVVYAAGGPIAWQSRLQTTVAVSTMEAEYMAAFGAIQELIWIKGC